jgi:multiple sugar transport system ATP-binding protein
MYNEINIKKELTEKVRFIIKEEVTSTNDELDLLAKKGEKEVTVGVRPVHITLADEGVASKVDVCEMMGSECHLHANVEGKDIIIVVPSTEIDVDKFMTAADEAIPVHFTFPSNLVHVFDKATGKNIF